MHEVRFVAEAVDGRARAGTATTARGAYQTPCFMPVGTRGAVKHLSARDCAEVGARIVLGNTYHLMLRPGHETVAALGGLGRFTGWDGLTLTDSGGYQFGRFSLVTIFVTPIGVFQSILAVLIGYVRTTRGSPGLAGGSPLTPACLIAASVEAGALEC